ncbi:MAG: SH3 domain-containing protein [Leptodesmis sp.]
MRGSGFLKVFSGFLIAFALVTGLGFFASQVLIAQFTTPPPKPIFPNDNPKPQPSPKTAASPPATQPASPAPSPSPSISPSPQASGYKARIVLDNGLNVREQPNAESSRIAGVDYDQQVTVLEESPDKEWQKIRTEPDGVVGWIKSGYTERLN